MSQNNASSSIQIYASTLQAEAAGLDQPVGIVCRMTQMGPGRVLRGQITHKLHFEDLNSTEKLVSVPVSDPKIVQLARDHLDSGERFVAYGSFVPGDGVVVRREIQGKEAALCFQLSRIAPVPSYSALLGVTPEETAWAERTYAELTGPAAPPDAIELFLLGESRSLLSLKTAGLSPRYRL